jgi:hypothetical protein
MGCERPIGRGAVDVVFTVTGGVEVVVVMRVEVAVTVTVLVLVAVRAEVVEEEDDGLVCVAKEKVWLADVVVWLAGVVAMLVWLELVALGGVAAPITISDAKITTITIPTLAILPIP